MQIKLNINTDFTKALEKISRSALPVAVRSTLNSVAFNVKQETLQKSVDANFTKRQPNFFKANSKVEMAKGFNIDAMNSVIAMVSSGLKGGNNYAVEDLAQQERGGSIKSKSFIPLSSARGSNSPARVVRPGNRLSGIKKIVDARKARGVNDRQKFVKSVAFAGIGGYVLAEFKGKEILWRVNSLNKTSSGQFKLTPLYSFERNRDVKVQGTGFMKTASLSSANHIQDYFIREAEKQFSKYSS